LKSYTIILVLLFSTGYFISDAYAYLDAGTGSIILQSLIGVLVGVAIALKIFWLKIKEKFSNISKKNET
jgi:membrane protein DedA with SNARE-associated domain